MAFGASQEIFVVVVVVVFVMSQDLKIKFLYNVLLKSDIPGVAIQLSVSKLAHCHNDRDFCSVMLLSASCLIIFCVIKLQM